MQFTKIVSVLALALTATAAPAEVVARNGGGGGGGSQTPSCENNNQVVSCCNAGGLGLLQGFCLLNVLNCVGGNQMCCNGESSGNSVISILDGACVGVLI